MDDTFCRLDDLTDHYPSSSPEMESQADLTSVSDFSISSHPSFQTSLSFPSNPFSDLSDNLSLLNSLSNLSSQTSISSTMSNMAALAQYSNQSPRPSGAAVNSPLIINRMSLSSSDINRDVSKDEDAETENSLIPPLSLNSSLTIESEHSISNYTAQIQEYWNKNGISLGNLTQHIDIGHLYNTVQKLGGIDYVRRHKRWPDIAIQMGLEQNSLPKIKRFYAKFLIPYEKHCCEIANLPWKEPFLSVRDEFSKNDKIYKNSNSDLIPPQTISPISSSTSLDNIHIHHNKSLSEKGHNNSTSNTLQSQSQSHTFPKTIFSPKRRNSQQTSLSSSSSSSHLSTILSSTPKKKHKKSQFRQQMALDIVTNSQFYLLSVHSQHISSSLSTTNHHNAFNPGVINQFTLSTINGHLYTSKISNVHHCDCPYYRQGHLCAHILFILFKIFKLSHTSHLLMKAKLSLSDLEFLYQHSPYFTLYHHEKPIETNISLNSPHDECSICFQSLSKTPIVQSNISSNQATKQNVSCPHNCGNYYHSSCYEIIKSRFTHCPLCLKTPITLSIELLTSNNDEDNTINIINNSPLLQGVDNHEQVAKSLRFCHHQSPTIHNISSHHNHLNFHHFLPENSNQMDKIEYIKEPNCHLNFIKDRLPSPSAPIDLDEMPLSTIPLLSTDCEKNVSHQDEIHGPALLVISPTFSTI